MAISVCVSRCHILFKLNNNVRSCGLRTINSAHNYLEPFNRRCEKRYLSTTKKKDDDGEESDSEKKKEKEQDKENKKDDDDDKKSKDVTVKYIRGLPHVTVPLPSRNEKCQFALRPVSHSVGDFLKMLLAEDKGIDRATIRNEDGVRIASACTIESLMDDAFWLHVNDKRYHVQPPQRKKLSLEEIQKVGDVQALVAQLYEALHVSEHQVKKERDLYARLEELHAEFQPLEKLKSEVAHTAERKTSSLTWVGLGLMSVQFGILARLTWWEYSWDIMEPVTYFVTYGTAMAAYAYYCLTRQEYNLRDVKDRQFLISLYKKAKKQGLEIEKYNKLKQQIADIEYDLRRLHDPLYLRMSPNATNTYTKDGLHAKHFLRTKSLADSIKITDPTTLKANKPFAGISQIFAAATKKLKSK